LARPPAEVHVDEETVRALLVEQCPGLAEAPLRRVDEGWDNFTFLLGDEHAVRLPRREAAVPLLLHELRWLPDLARDLPLLTPLPVHHGRPGAGFGWPWSVVRWVAGDTAEGHAFGRSDAALLAETLRRLHRPAPDEAPGNPFRGVRLALRAEAVHERLERVSGRLGPDAAAIGAVWEDAVSAPEARKRRWMHGDLHPRNVVVRDGAVAGLIDWGDLNGGDAATDLACAWTLIDDAGVRRELLDTYGASEQEVRRARGWAVHMGLALLEAEEPRHVPLGRATLRRVALDA
jgi:aminoglycoside phosphotransferase (APT) family kinase protein